MISTNNVDFFSESYTSCNYISLVDNNIKTIKKNEM